MLGYLLMLLIINAALSFIANHVINFSALSITPISVILIAHHGGTVWVAAPLLVLAYAIVSIDDLAYLWITLPLAFFTGYLALGLDNIAALLLIYHAIGAAFAFNLGYFDTRYAAFMTINYTLNYALGSVAFLI
jgi:hypothetical protein